eukprot:3416832-Rhodomonas_salina.1
MSPAPMLQQRNQTHSATFLVQKRCGAIKRIPTRPWYKVYCKTGLFQLISRCLASGHSCPAGSFCEGGLLDKQVRFGQINCFPRTKCADNEANSFDFAGRVGEINCFSGTT